MPIETAPATRPPPRLAATVLTCALIVDVSRGDHARVAGARKVAQLRVRLRGREDHVERVRARARDVDADHADSRGGARREGRRRDRRLVGRPDLEVLRRGHVLPEGRRRARSAAPSRRDSASRRRRGTCTSRSRSARGRRGRAPPTVSVLECSGTVETPASVVEASEPSAFFTYAWTSFEISFFARPTPIATEPENEPDRGCERRGAGRRRDRRVVVGRDGHARRVDPGRAVAVDVRVDLRRDLVDRARARTAGADADDAEREATEPVKTVAVIVGGLGRGDLELVAA